MAIPQRTSGSWLSVLSLGVLVADRLSKFLVDRFMPLGAYKVLIPELLNLMHTTNSGVAFGFLADSGSPWTTPVLVVFSAAVIGFLIWLLVSGRAGGFLGQVGMAMILGGACGNVFDRVLRHSVTDFIDFHLGRYHWYTFNFADSAIVIGAALVVIELLRDWSHPGGERDGQPPSEEND
jgi:signal peptidase II